MLLDLRILCSVCNGQSRDLQVPQSPEFKAHLSHLLARMVLFVVAVVKVWSNETMFIGC